MSRKATKAALAVLLATVLCASGCGKTGATAPVYETRADVFMLRANNNPNPSGPPDYRYFVLSSIQDLHLTIESASLTGMGRTSAYALNSSTKTWWDDVGSRYSTQDTPVFPMQYTIHIRYTGGRTETLTRTVTSWSPAR
jgi:hypothetical protein